MPNVQNRVKNIAEKFIHAPTSQTTDDRHHCRAISGT